jgi:hypothetical protein
MANATSLREALRPDDPKADHGPLLKLFLEDVTNKIYAELERELLAKAKPLLYAKAQEATQELQANLLTHYEIRTETLSVWLCVKDDGMLKKVEPI